MAITRMGLKLFWLFFLFYRAFRAACSIKKDLLADRIVIEEAPYGFPHDLGDGDVASIRVVHVLLQLKVKAFWNDQTAISSSWHSLLLAEHCLFKVSIFPISSSYRLHLSSTSMQEINDISELDDLDR